MTATPSPPPSITELLRMLQFGDAMLPVGAFSFSGGLESPVQQGIKPGDYDATVATGFLVAGPYPGQVTAKTVEPIRYDQLDDMVAMIGSSVLGMTIGCARCHDHKYDAIGHRDYYSMIACLGKAVQRDANIDPDPATTKEKRDAWLAERAPFGAAIDRFRRDEVPGRVRRWLAADASRHVAESPWIGLDPQSAKAAKATLAEEPDDVVARDLMPWLARFDADELPLRAIGRRGPGEAGDRG